MPRSGVLAELARRARHPLLLVNDSDIVVEPGYLRAVVGAAGRPERRPGDVPVPRRGRILAVARGGARDRDGVRAERAGGAAAGSGGVRARLDHGVPRRVAARDRRLRGDRRLPGRRLPARPAHHRTAWAKRIEFAPVVVETRLGAESWLDVWRHQLRWSRTIRVSRPVGYYGYVVTHATLWALVAFAAGNGRPARWRSGCGCWRGSSWRAGVLGDRRVMREFWMIPVPRPLRLRGLARRTLRQRCPLARQTPAPAPDGRIGG